MLMLRRIVSGFRRLIHKTEVEQDMNEELRAYLETAAEEKMAAGMPHEAAVRAARVEIGSLDAVKERAREIGWESVAESLWQDIRYALRILRRSPGFTAVAVLTLALGVGANTAIFTLIDAVLLKSLPVRDPGGLVLLGDARGFGVGRGLYGSFFAFSHELYQHLRDTNVFEDLFAFQSSASEEVSVRYTGSGTAQPAGAKLVSGNYFDVLGVNAAHGRTIVPSDDSPSAPPVAVVSFRYWQDRLDGASSAVGSTVALNGVPIVIVGVAPPEFHGETLQPDPPGFWLPISADRHLNPARTVIDDPGAHWLYLMGRLKPGLSAAQGETRLTAALQNWLITREGSSISDERRRRIADSHVELTPGGSGIPRMRRSYSQTLRLLLGISTAVLLIACANIANLLLARGASRHAETSVRLALGASRGRLVRQSLTESLTLALIGGALGLLVALAGAKLLVALAFRGTNYVPIQAAPDFLVLAFAFVLSCAAAVGFGLLPAMRTTSVARPSIGVASRGVHGSVSRGKCGLSNLLIVGEVALSLVVLAAAGLFVRSLMNLTDQRFGFDRENVLVVGVDPGLARYDYTRLGPLYQQMDARLNSLPGVKSAGFSYYSPFNGCCWGYSVSVQGYTPQPQENMQARLNRVSPRYFETLGTRVLLGRAFDEHDTPMAPRVAVVNEAFVDRYLQDGNPIGRRFGIDRDGGTPADLEIVGVVENAKYDSPREDPTPMAFLPLLQVRQDDAASAARDGSNFINAVEVRATGNPIAVVGQIRQVLAEIDPGLPVLRVDALSDHIGRELNQENVIAVLTMCFGLLALVLACIGLYGLTAYTVQRRTSEIGIRMALGANRGMVIGMVLRQALFQGAVGILIGIPAALAATQLVASQLYGVSPSDPKYSVAAALVLVLCITIAGYVPARRAAKVDPMVALRCE
jgi:predicted permease